MNHLQKFDKLNNRYLALRHGKSAANEKKIIISSPEVGTIEYGLVDEGRMQVRLSIAQALEKGILDDKIVILSSDFTRAVETAEITRAMTGTSEPVRIREELRERFFGLLDGKSDKHYKDVWDLDKIYPHHKFHCVESSEETQTRTTSLIADLEKQYSGQTFVLASHGDALQILDTGFKKISPKYHRDIPHLQTAELRELILKN